MRVKSVFCLCASLLMAVQTSFADDSAVKEQSPAEATDVRFMLGAPADDGVEQIEPRPEQFAWASLVKNSPASGAEPRIGALGDSPYFDFRDGYDVPRYFVK